MKKNERTSFNYKDIIYTLDKKLTIGIFEILRIQISFDTIAQHPIAKIFCTKKDSKTEHIFFPGDCGVPGWKYDSRPQTLFKSVELLFENISKALKLYGQ